MTALNSGPWAETARFGVVLGFIATCFLWGGGSRLDIPGLLFLYPAAFFASATLLLLPGPFRWDVVRAPLLLLLALALVIAAQLIPLPPAIWNGLPGHYHFAEFAQAAGAEGQWRPLSLTPDNTLASLIGLCVPATALLTFASLNEAQTHRLLTWLLAAVLLSAVFGLAQIVGGPESGFYRYAVTNENSAVGLFSNRNHQAVFLVAAWPMLALWATVGIGDPAQRRARRWVAGLGAVALFPILVAAGSRAGLAFALFGFAAGWILLRRGDRDGAPEGSGGRPGLRAIVALGGVAAALAVALALPRSEAFERLLGTAFADESRLAFLPILTQIAADFLPFGSGFGSFDPVFRFYEPDALLAATYLNHAHNDPLELLITGGVPAVMVALAFLLWAGRAVVATLTRSEQSRCDRFALLGLAIIVLMLLSSLVDYPLRTPALAALFAFSCGWLGAARGGRGRTPVAG